MEAEVKASHERNTYRIFLIHCSLFIFLPIVVGCGAPHKQYGIVSIGPNITEILFLIGAGNKVVGIGDFDDYPPEIKDYPKVGTYLSPNIEKITSLTPKIIITAGEIPQLATLAREINAQYYSIPMDNLEEIYAGIIKLGEITNCSSRAQKLVEEMKNKLKNIEDKTKSLEPVPTLLVVGREPRVLSSIQVAGGKSFLSEILKIAGGKECV